MTSLPLLEALGIGAGAVVALAGGGGKTSLMWALAREAGAAGWRVLTTTTTRILPPAADESQRLVLLRGAADSLLELRRAFSRTRHVTAADHARADGKLAGLEPRLVDAIAAARLAELVVVEADGAAGRPLKAAREGEPVYPASTTLAVMVLGIDALGAPLDEAHVFRAALAGGITGLAAGAPVDAPAMAKLLSHAAAKAPRRARLAVLVNKADDEALRRAGGELAHELIARGAPRFERVAVGSLADAGRGFALFEK